MKNMIDLKNGINPIDIVPTVPAGYDGGFCLSYRWVGDDFFGCVARLDSSSKMTLTEAVAGARAVNAAREEEIRWNLANR